MVPRSPAVTKHSLALGIWGLGRRVVPQQGLWFVCHVAAWSWPQTRKRGVLSPALEQIFSHGPLFSSLSWEGEDTNLTSQPP